MHHLRLLSFYAKLVLFVAEMLQKFYCIYIYIYGEKLATSVVRFGQECLLLFCHNLIV